MCENHDPRVAAATSGASDAFHAFVHEAPAHAEAWQEMAHRLEHASALDPASLQLAYVAVLAALGLESGIPFHVELARDAGATREQVASAVLVGLPAAGSRVIACLPVALAAFDHDEELSAEQLEAMEAVTSA